MAARNLDGILSKKSNAIYRGILEPLGIITEEQWESLGWECFNIPRLVEKALEIASDGLYECINTDGYDFTDKSEAKTLCVKDISAPKFELRGISNKVGPLRIVCYNEIRERLHFFYIPYDEWQNLTRVHSSGPRIVSSYNKKTNRYSRLEKYRCMGFEDLAQMNEKEYDRSILKYGMICSVNRLIWEGW